MFRLARILVVRNRAVLYILDIGHLLSQKSKLSIFASVGRCSTIRGYELAFQLKSQAEATRTRLQQMLGGCRAGQFSVLLLAHFERSSVFLQYHGTVPSPSSASAYFHAYIISRHL